VKSNPSEVVVTFDHVIPNDLLIEWNQSMMREVQTIWVQGESVSMIQQKNSVGHMIGFYVKSLLGG
jgi:hypothetical protein